MEMNFIMFNKGMDKNKQMNSQIEKQDGMMDVEFAEEFQVRNTGEQSQKKSGRQAEKK
jgi:hypothetical protein